MSTASLKEVLMLLLFHSFLKKYGADELKDFRPISLVGVCIKLLLSYWQID